MDSIDTTIGKAIYLKREEEGMSEVEQQEATDRDSSEEEVDANLL